MQQLHTFLRSSFLLIALATLVTTTGCKKKQDDDPTPVGSVGIQITLPAGSSVDLSKASVYSLSQSFGVASDGKANIAFKAGSYEVIFVYDENNKPMLAGIISDDNKEISVSTTAQALLYYGLGLMYSNSNEERIAAIKKIPTYPQYAELKTKLEQLFVAAPSMLSTGTYTEAYLKALSGINIKPVLDLIGKQIKVQDADTFKSGVSVSPSTDNDESVVLNNKYKRRGHAYFYKMAYRDNTNFPHTVKSQIYNYTTAEHDLAVLGAKGNPSPVSGPQALPLESNETESTWKVRVVGVGSMSSGIVMTDVEKAEYERQCIDFFAVDVLMADVLTQVNQSDIIFQVIPNDIERVRNYIDIVKTKVRPSTIDLIKSGDYTDALEDFREYALYSSPLRVQIYQALMQGLSGLIGNSSEQAWRDIEQNQEKQQSFLEFAHHVYRATIDEVVGGGSVISGPVEAHYIDVRSCNALEEWTVISKDNDVTITPKHSDALVFTNHTLKVSATADLSAGESIQYVWSTAGTFGKFKENGQDVATTSPSASTTVIYYGNNALNEDNIETIYVTASITGPNGTRKIGTDTAYVNVKSNAIVMKPNGVTLSPKHGTKSVTLRLLNQDGSDPIIQGSAVQHKVEWSIPGTYGKLDGNATTYVSSRNSIIYTATDEDVLSGVENITARVYFKLSSTDWMLKDEVKGIVRINNDPKKITYYAPLTSYHMDANDWHYTNCGVAITPVDDAVSYSVAITLPQVYPPTYYETWLASDTSNGWCHGYMYAIDANSVSGTFYAGYGASWGGCVNGDCDHSVADCGGGSALITITVQ